MHLTNFLEVCDTIKYNGVTEEALKLRLFPLSLGDKAKHWLTSQPPDSITTWTTRGGELGRGMGQISRITKKVPASQTNQMDASPYFL